MRYIFKKQYPVLLFLFLKKNLLNNLFIVIIVYIEVHRRETLRMHCEYVQSKDILLFGVQFNNNSNNKNSNDDIDNHGNRNNNNTNNSKLQYVIRVYTWTDEGALGGGALPSLQVALLPPPPIRSFKVLVKALQDLIR